MRYTVRYSLLSRILPGFTLIELLVVISIIALLLSILMPALNSAKDSARSSICQTNLHQIGFGIFMYSQDNNGRMPPLNEYYHTDIRSGGRTITNIMSKYVPVDGWLCERCGDVGPYGGTWTCPSTPRHLFSDRSFPGFHDGHDIDVQASIGAQFTGGYSVNEQGMFWYGHDPSGNPNPRACQSLANLRQPSNRWFMGDGWVPERFAQLGDDSGGYTWAVVYGNLDSDPGNRDFRDWAVKHANGNTYYMKTPQPAIRHRGDKYCNVVLADGHTESYAFDELEDNIHGIFDWPFD